MPTKLRLFVRVSDPAESKQAEPPSNVEGFPSTHIHAYEESAEIFKVELWNLCVEHMDDDFPPDWMVGILESIKLALIYEE